MEETHKVKNARDIQNRVSNTGVGAKTFKESQPKTNQQAKDMNNTTISAGGFT